MSKVYVDPKLFRAVKAYAPGKKVLDIGCGNKAYSGVSDDVTTLDAWENVKPDIVLDLEVENLPFENDSFQCVLMIDFIEHMSKERGVEILEQAKNICSGRIYLLTPQWWDSNEGHTNNPRCWAYKNPWNIHKSFWEAREFTDGWTSIGHTTHDGKFFWGFWEKSE